MKKFLLSIFLFTVAIFTNVMATEIKDIKAEIEKGRFYQAGIIIADMKEADTFLELLHKAKGDVSKNQLVLILPDADTVDKNLEKLAKRVDRVRLLMLSIKSDNKILKNRSIEDLKTKAVYKKKDALKNVAFNELVMTEEYLNERIQNDGSIDKLIQEVYERVKLSK